jgi:hypothetical protein
MNPGVYHQAARRLWRRERVGGIDPSGSLGWRRGKKGTGPTAQTTSITELLVVFFFFLFLCFSFLFGIRAIYFHFDLCQVPTIRLPATVCVLCHSAPSVSSFVSTFVDAGNSFFFLFLDFFFLWSPGRRLIRTVVMGYVIARSTLFFLFSPGPRCRVQSSIVSSPFQTWANR